jgi:hypothetical protein
MFDGKANVITKERKAAVSRKEKKETEKMQLFILETKQFLQRCSVGYSVLSKRLPVWFDRIRMVISSDNRHGLLTKDDPR